MQIEKYLAFLPSFLLLSGCATFEIAGEIQSGRMALMKGNPQEALAHFQRAAQSDPNYIAGNPLQQTVWTYVGRAYYTMGKLPDARQALEQALSHYPQDRLARLYLGLTLIRQEKDYKPENPFSLSDIVYALREGISFNRVATLARERGIDFELTKDGEAALKTAGADDQLIEALRKAGMLYANKGAVGGSTGEQGLKEVEAALRELHNWLESIPHSTTWGQFWDPGRQIRTGIQANLTMIAGKKIDFQKFTGGAESVGMKLEEEIDRARRDEQEHDKRMQQRP